jgi:GMP synthase (glutamine-hydrolysing)
VRIAQIFEQAGYTLELRSLSAGAAVPQALDPADVLVVMGGPMSVSDVGSEAYPWLALEIELLRRRLLRSEPVLGICLGAQLLAHAAGARVYPNRDAAGCYVLEVGFAPVTFADVEREPVLAGLHREELMFHWHGDTFELPEGSVPLASSKACRHQAFRIGRHAYALQFHPEVDVATVADWVRLDAEYVTRALGAGGTERVLRDARDLMPAWHAVGDRLISNIVQEFSSHG